jgi:hypothetical protein
MWLSSGSLRRVVQQKSTDASKVLSGPIIRAVGISETSINFHETTRRNITEQSSSYEPPWDREISLILIYDFTD